MKTLFETSATATGGRNGHVRSEDGVLDMDVRIPNQMGGKGGEFTNPEQLFAAGYSACFDNAIIHVAQAKKLKLSSSTTAKIGLAMTEDKSYQITAALHITMEGVDQATAEQVVAAAHSTCPYSNAIKGNVEVKLSVEAK
ncbi:organic hydroperoxide resistance protein [Echinicola pacifica]|uniref:Organic hydroperoxide resistance protein n=1 Tax=Echinicola pacifica TaxID=346377 RepID=A0A918Q3U9_9BACT|nr:organic hydroperoxide resistance protein [Echinicola pacifica]GGZ32704.1 organic hydroperoxide resistance protein [Echinicola pacifica]